MKILVNAMPLLMPLTGIGQYIRSLFTAMDTKPGADIRMYYGLRCEKGVRPMVSASAQKVTGTLRVLQNSKIGIKLLTLGIVAKTLESIHNPIGECPTRVFLYVEKRLIAHCFCVKHCH